MVPQCVPPQNEDRYLRWVGSLQLAKGLLLLGVAFGILSFLHKDLDALVGNWIEELGMDLQNPRIIQLLAKLDLVTDQQIGEWSVVTFCFAGMFVTEGTGLLLRRQWAKYFTVFATAAFIPLEAYTLATHFNFMKLGLLLVNSAVLWLLIVLLRREKARESRPGCIARVAESADVPEEVAAG